MLVMFLSGGSGLLAAETLLIGQPPIQANFVSVAGNGELHFQTDNQPLSVPADKLIRWSAPHINLEHDEILLADGSQLVFAESWTGAPSWQLEGEALSVVSSTVGSIELKRSQVRAILLQAPTTPRQRTRFVDQLQDKHQETDTLYLTSGDRWQGKFVGTLPNPTGNRSIQWLLESASEPIVVPENRIAAISLHDTAEPPKTQAKLVVGLRDGSLLRAESLTADAEQLALRLTNGVELTGTDARDVVYLRSLTADCVYLSDLPAADYQSIPYLDIPWPYRRDRNVLGGPLRVAGWIYPKGLGMHTAARLTFRLDTPPQTESRNRFVAAVAVDEAASNHGSVFFRVYLEQDGQWQQAYASPIVRGGEEPLPISIELNGAKQLALVTDFADHGDQRDDADWLDARLE